MSDANDELQMNLLNENTEGMIKQQVSRLKQQKSFRKRPSFIQKFRKDSMAFSSLNIFKIGSIEDSSPLPRQLKSIFSIDGAEDDCLKSFGPRPTLRRAITYCGEQAIMEHHEENKSEASESQMSQTPTLTSKHCRYLQAQQAWIK